MPRENSFTRNPYSPIINHAQTRLKRTQDVTASIDNLVKRTYVLMQRVSRMNQSEYVSATKTRNIKNYEQQIKKNILEMHKKIQLEKMAIENLLNRIQIAYQRSHEMPKEFTQLQLAKEKLESRSAQINKIFQLSYAPTTPKTDPFAESFPSVPKSTTSRIIDALDLAGIVKTARTNGWTAADREITKFAKENRVNAIAVKKEVINELGELKREQLEGKFEKVFGQKPVDRSSEAPQLSSISPRRRGR